MPPLLTQVARLSDGMPLVATVTANPGVPVSTKDQQEAKDILRSLTHQYVQGKVYCVCCLFSVADTIKICPHREELLESFPSYQAIMCSTTWSAIRCAT